MDKDMIHIDDFVRGQFSEREEDERPGAWLHMRELLDKKMPAGRPTPFNWRRLGGYMVILALLGVVVSGGYILTQHTPSDVGVHAKSIQAPAVTAPAGYVGAAKLPNNSHPNNNVRSESEHSNARSATPIIPESVDPQAAADTRHPNTTAASIAHANGGTAPLHHTAPSPPATADLPTPTHHTSPQAVTEQAEQTASTHRPVSDSSAHITAARHQENLQTLTPRSSVQTDNSTVHTPTPQVLQRAKSAMPTLQSGVFDPHTTQPHPTRAGTTETLTTQANTAKSGGKSADANTHTGGDDHNSEWHTTTKDTATQINLVARTVVDPVSRTRTQVIDTVSIEAIVIDKQEPKAATDITPPLHSPIAIHSGQDSTVVPSTTEMEGEATTLHARSKRETRKSGQNFQDMYLNTKFKLAQAPFYLGITGGVNAMSAGGRLIPGIHLGLSSELELNERWSVLAELKYINRFNSGTTIDDPYRGKPYPVVPHYQGGTAYTVYNRDSLNHYFNFSTIGTGNLPITVKYSVNRFFMLAGVDLVYHFRMNAEEIELPVTGSTLRDTLLSSAAPTTLTGSDPSIQLRDLGARLGVGYLLGVGYKATPNLHMDLRLTHTFWDNAATGGEKKVSNQLFRVPALQFSLGYRLGGTQRTP